jgi:hypothetical protein
MPAGRHCDSVFSPEVLWLRRFVESAASVRIGSSPRLKSSKMLMPYFEMVGHA